MGLFISSPAAATLHGAYAIQRTAPPVIQATGTGIAMLLGQFPWGPVQSVYQPSGYADLISTFAPFGMSHTGSAWLATEWKAFPQLWIERILSAAGSPAPATANLPNGVPTTVVVVTLKYNGTAGNSVTCTVSAASDGNANHFNLTVSVTGLSGTTSDIFTNLNVSGVGADYLGADVIAKARLVGTITKSITGIPVAGTVTCTGGADGSAITSADYVGTQGAGDKGLAKTEGYGAINHIFYDDMGNTIRSACNSGMQAHVEFRSDRMGVINGNSGLAAGAAVTDAASYQSQWLRYVDVWPYINRSVDGAKTLVPPNAFLASVASQLAPSMSSAWKNPEVTVKMLAGIVDLETNRGANAYNNTLGGVCTLQPEPNGGFSFESDVTTLFPSDPTKKYAHRSQMAIYIAKSGTSSIRSSVDGPNVPYNQQPIVDAFDRFLSQLKKNRDIDPNHLPYINDYSIDDLPTFNSTTDIAGGQYTVPATVQTGADMEKIIFSLNLGENVTVNHNQ